tara:strand:+ start:608 stop:1123 length:516 start_codon:yes stop_codon:yes gene_type:complete
MTDAAAALGRLAGLEHESIGALHELADLFEARRYEGADLCRQVDPADKFWVLTSGTVSVIRTTSRSTPVEVALLEPCTLIGIAGLVGIDRRVATLRAHGPVEVLEMQSSDACKRIDNPASLVGGTLRRALIAAMARQVRHSNVNIAKLAVAVGVAERVVDEQSLISAITVF